MTQAPPIVFVTCAYGSDYAGFLLPHIASTHRWHPGAPHLLLWQDIPEHEIQLLQELFPSLVCHRTEEYVAGSSVLDRIPNKLKLWIKACDLYPAHQICFLDADTLVCRSLFPILPSNIDAAFTWKPGRFPINVGVFLVLNGKRAKPLLSEWLQQTLDTLRCEFEVAREESGAADQHALRKLIGFGPYENYSKEIAIGNTIFRVGGIPCSLLNQTECAPITESTYIIHYKSGWHPILFKGAPFSTARPADRCRPMHEFFNAAFAEALSSNLTPFILTRAEQARDRLSRAAVKHPYEERGILHSEMLAVTALCESLGVDVIIESGRCRGQSTAILAEYFSGTSTRIESIEYNRDENSSFAEQRLASYDIGLHYGDSFRVLPRQLKKQTGKRIALLIDGPKGEAAVSLLRDALHFSNNIVAAFIHDAGPDTPAREAILRSFRRVYFTDCPRYVDSFRELDAMCLPRGGVITEHTWRPFLKGEQRIPSYGPTLAVILPYCLERSARRASAAVLSREAAINLARSLGIPAAVRKIRRNWLAPRAR